MTAGKRLMVTVKTRYTLTAYHTTLCNIFHTRENSPAKQTYLTHNCQVGWSNYDPCLKRGIHYLLLFLSQHLHAGLLQVVVHKWLCVKRESPTAFRILLVVFYILCDKLCTLMPGPEGLRCTSK